MKKLILLGLLAVSLVANSFALSTAVTIPTATMTNLFVPAGGSVKITQLIAVSPVNNTTAFQVYDTPTNSTQFIQAAFIGGGNFQTNVVTTWTNYYGKVNSFTNIAQIDYTNTVAAITNYYPLRIAGNIATNSSLQFNNVNYYFGNGVWVTNTGVGSVTITVTYEK